MLNDWNTMENANLLEKNLLKKVGDLPIGTIICGLKQDNEIGLWVVCERCDNVVYLYNTKSYFDNTFIVKIDNETLYFEDYKIQDAKEYFNNKLYDNEVKIDIKTRYEKMPMDFSKCEPNTRRFYFNISPVSKKQRKVEIELVDTRNWSTRIFCDTYVLPLLNSNQTPFYSRQMTEKWVKIAKSVYSQLKYRFENPNEYEICNYLIYSEDSHENKIKMLEKLQQLPDNYHVVDINYSIYRDEFTIKIDDVKIDLNTKISDGVVKLLSLQECHHCDCDNCKYKVNGVCLKNVQMLKNNTPCNLYSPSDLCKAFKLEWDGSTTEDRQDYLKFVKEHLKDKNIIIDKEDNTTYFTDNIDRVFNRRPSEDIIAKYKETYFPRWKNKYIIEEF